MHLKRILSAAVLLPPVLLLIWYGPRLLFAALVATVAGLMAWEFYGLLGTRFGPLPRPLGVLLAAAVAAAPGLPAGAEAALLLLGFAVMSAAVTLLLRTGSPEHGLGQFAATLLPVLYAGGLLGFTVALRGLPGGREYLLYLLAVTWVADTAAFYGGMALGRTPLSPRVSPRKTVEGSLAGLVAGASVSLLLQTVVWGALTWWGAAFLGLLLTAAGQVGDLAESLCKRSAGVKDTGSLLPGHGGFLDRLDSLLFAAPVLYLVVRLRWL
jgi:phosphatidate cytidylyltransferase